MPANTTQPFNDADVLHRFVPSEEDLKQYERPLKEIFVTSEGGIYCLYRGGAWSEGELDSLTSLVIAHLLHEREALTTKEQDLRNKVIQSHEEICQTLGQALGYPRYCDDQRNFPGSTEEHGVCVGDQVAETLALSAAERIKALTTCPQCSGQPITVGDETIQPDDPQHCLLCNYEHEAFCNRRTISRLTATLAKVEAERDLYQDELREVVRRGYACHDARIVLEKGAKLREEK